VADEHKMKEREIASEIAKINGNIEYFKAFKLDLCAQDMK
jgi:hypothetical protein